MNRLYVYIIFGGVYIAGKVGGAKGIVFYCIMLIIGGILIDYIGAVILSIIFLIYSPIHFIVFDKRKLAQKEAEEYPAKACDEPIFLGFRFGMSEEDVNETLLHLEEMKKIELHITPIYHILPDKDGKIYFYYHNNELYKIAICTYARGFEIGERIHKHMISNGYRYFGILFFLQYYYTKKNIVVTITEEKITNTSYKATLEYVDAPVEAAIKNKQNNK